MTDTETNTNINTETNTNIKSSLENVNEFFKIPICYNDKVKKLKDSVITDLELVNSIEKDTRKFKPFA